MSRASSETTADSEVFRELVFRRLPLAVMAVVAMTAAVGGAGWSERLGPLPWLISLAAVGLPHGAADFAISRRLCRGWPLVAVWCIYVVAMVVVATGFVLAPLAAMSVFLVVSCWHFGAAHRDADDVDLRDRDGIGSILSRGCAVLAAPLVVWPTATAGVAADLADLAGSRADVAVFLPPKAIMAAGLVLAAVALSAATVEGVLAVRRPGGTTAWRRLVGELVVITSLGVFTDPLFAVGTYFLVWHAWRQMAALDGTLSTSPARAGSELVRHLVRIHAAALPLLLPTWIAIGAVWWLWTPEHTLRGLAIVSIGGYLVVTPAHELLGDFLRTTAAMPAGSRSSIWLRGGCRIRPEPRGTAPCDGTSRSGLGRVRPAAWG